MESTFFGHGRPILVAGPCAAESETQLKLTAGLLKSMGKVSLFRCGCWKMRSKPDGFDGMGDAALPVLQRIQDDLSLPACVEVAVPLHLEAMLRYGIRCCWIGARTTVNPQQVSEIAEAARGTAVSVMVKNPVVPDIRLWEGAVERLQQAGIADIAAVHRGFSTVDAAPYRNRPLWHLAIEWKRRHPELPLICDPSHIAGCRELLAEVSQKALNLDFDGLMVEVHPSPETALSDARQQLSPDAFGKLVSTLRFPSVPTADGKLLPYRMQLDELDSELLSLLSRRMGLARKISIVKREENLPLLQLERWRDVLDDALRQADKLGLERGFVEELMRLIHSASLDEQEKVFREMTETAPKPHFPENYA